MTIRGPLVDYFTLLTDEGLGEKSVANWLEQISDKQFETIQRDMMNLCVGLFFTAATREILRGNKKKTEAPPS